MLSKVQAFFAFGLLSVMIARQLSAMPANRTPCIDALGIMNKRNVGLNIACRKNMTFVDNKDRLDRAACVSKCILIQDSVLTSAGLVDGSQAEHYLEREVPEILRDRARLLVAPCFKQFADKLDPKDEFCKSYDPFADCVLHSTTKLCEHEREGQPLNPMKVIDV